MKNSSTENFKHGIAKPMLCDGFLVPMTDFVIEYAPKFNPFGTDEQILCLDYIHNYAKFLKQPLKLGMFVPCNKEGNVYAYEYEEPIQEDYWSENGTVYSGELFKHDLNRYMKYKKAKEKVLFEGFDLNQKDLSKLENIFCLTKEYFQITFFTKEKGCFIDNLKTNKTYEIKTIEDLIEYDLQLTENAIKQIGL